MKIHLRLMACTLGLFSLVQNWNGQPLLAHGQQPSNRKRQPHSVEINIATQQRQQAVLTVQGFADRSLKFQDIKAKVRTLAGLADLLWKEDRDYAQKLFLTAYSSLSLNELKTSKSDLSADELSSLRKEVITRVASHDPALARRLIDSSSTNASNTTASERAQINLRSAGSLIKENPEEAVKFAERSLQGGVQERMLGFLFELRHKDEAIANKLYIETLDNLIVQPVIDINILLTLGAYVFTSPNIDSADPSLYRAVDVVAVGNHLVVNISAERSNISPDVVRAYLNVATIILTRPVSDREQKQLFYIAGYQLLPHLQRFIPDRASQLIEAMQLLIPDVPSTMTETSSYIGLGVEKKPDVSDVIREIDSTLDEGQHDLKCLTATYDLYRTNDLSGAYSIAVKTKNLATRIQLINVIKFAEAARSLEQGDFLTAEEGATSLPLSVERIVLWLGIGHARGEKGDRSGSVEAINNAIKDTRRIEDGRKSTFTLAAAGELAKYDLPSAIQVLNEAIRIFNGQEDEALRDVRLLGLEQKVEALNGQTWRYFPLHMKGIRYGFDRALPPVAMGDSDGAISAVLNLKNEDALGQGLVALAAALLK